MTVTTDTAALWTATHAERARLADDLAGLTAEQWAAPSLCGDWTVEEVVAHLTAAASIGRWRWIASMVGARFDPAVHNARRLAEHRGATPAETLERFRAVVTSTVAPSGHTPAWLGEVVVHGEDVRRPLGIADAPQTATTTPVAAFFASRDFTVAGKTVTRGLRLEATDGPFAAGEGPRVTGPTLALVMAMAGRVPHLDELEGPGVATLRERLSTPPAAGR
ncbi:MAG TPA: maleylpyruvate isomerase family mycothiol-dependent enzyme [Actinomycetospora sp.]|nr:maleylpyruvate isomerase family mycothiol-dependent enzyme [Actinomycetospora sp.]